MKEKLSAEQNQAILKALDETLTTGPWTDSNFLRVIGKNLQEIRDGLAVQMEKTIEIDNRGSKKIQPVMKTDQQEVFISLYSSEGNQLHSWERIISNLPRQLISRPIYTEEENVQTLIKTKENKLNEAYVSVIINTSDILSLGPDKTPQDKLGKVLLTIKDRAIHSENITKFIHQTGVYTLMKGKLIKNESNL